MNEIVFPSPLFELVIFQSFVYSAFLNSDSLSFYESLLRVLSNNPSTQTWAPLLKYYFKEYYLVEWLLIFWTAMTVQWIHFEDRNVFTAIGEFARRIGLYQPEEIDGFHTPRAPRRTVRSAGRRAAAVQPPEPEEEETLVETPTTGPPPRRTSRARGRGRGRATTRPPR